MGWVTLTLRKTELKRTHSDYQMELLQISRDKRKLARESHYEQMLVRNDYNGQLRDIYDTYREHRGALNDQLSSANQQGGVTGIEGGDDKTSSQIQTELDQEREDYQREANEIRAQMDEELQMLEEQANDQETELDQRQVEVEAQLEAISAEIEAVGEAISSQIQASTIKLS